MFYIRFSPIVHISKVVILLQKRKVIYSVALPKAKSMSVVAICALAYLFYIELQTALVSF